MRSRSAPRVRVGISSCLLGERVRYDGGHKLCRTIVDRLGGLFEWVPVCPEVELGLGVPRETLRLEGQIGTARLVFTDSRGDITRRMNDWSRRRILRLEALGLCGYVLKSRSPSCGKSDVPLHPKGAAGRPTRKGTGLFARALMDRFPLLPVEDEEQLRDPALLDDFVQRVLRYHSFRDILAPRAPRRLSPDASCPRP